MKVLRYLIVIIGVILFLSGTPFARDTDLYMASGAGVEPNILIIFDNSGSMAERIPLALYNYETEYPPAVVPVADKNKVYYSASGGRWLLFKNSIAEVACPDARTALTYNGHYEGNTNSTCTKNTYTLRTGNYRNFLATDGSQTDTKLNIAKRVVNDFLDTINGVKVGVMIFNTDEGGRLLDSQKTYIRSLTPTVRSELKTAIGNLTASTWTPLGETLYEAGIYFRGGRSYFNSGVNYISPIEFHCQRNYVILMTDGEPTKDKNSVLKDGATVGGVTYPKIGDQDGDKREPGMVNDPNYPDDGSDYLDDVAKYLYDTDLRSDLTGKQNIITYTIGFDISSSLLERAAIHGHGKYFYAQSSQQLASAFQNIIGEILAKSTSFVAPIVPVSRLERATAGDKIYLAFFKPLSNQVWSGNIKKYGVAQTDNPSLGIRKGDIVDATGAKAVDSKGQFYSTARSFWTSSSTMDGGEVEEGGVGEVLLNRTTARNLYTYFYTNVNLNHSSNAFTTSNSLITPSVLGYASGDTDARNKLINFVHGYDAYDDNANGNTSEKRDWILGSFLHSRPVIIHYPNPSNPNLTRSVIFAGSNGGMLHAFDDSDGRELWGFIPPNLLNTLKAMRADVLATFVDGSPRAYVTYKSDGSVDQAILMFGLRRGGDRYYALDVANPDSPKFLWEIGPTKRVYQTTTYNTTDYQRMGETWASPVIGKIAYGTGEKWVAFIGGGYDTKEDTDPVEQSDTVGMAVYVVDVLTGSLVRRFSVDDSGYSDMTYAIPSDIAKVDTDGNGYVDRLYVGDLGGRIWRFDIGDSNPNQWTGRIIFRSNPTPPGTNDRRKIFYPPDVTLERDATGPYEMLFFGTGDREAPKEENVVNRLYAIKDRYRVSGGIYTPSAPLQESDLTNVTNGLSPGTPVTNGWFILLENSGEKCLAAPVVFHKIAYFTTFTPSNESNPEDPCFVGEGPGRLYALKYSTGDAVFNWDATNDVGGTAVISKSDRSLVMGSAIPSGVIITFIGGTAVAYAGVGGGVYSPELASTRSLVPMTWRIVF